MDLLSYSSLTDSEIYFYYNILTARKVKKLGVNGEVQVTDFVSRLEIAQHSGAEVSESSLGCFSRST